MPDDDTMVSISRFWIVSKLLLAALWVAPDGDSKTMLKVKLSEWAVENERQWYLRYPRQAK